MGGGQINIQVSTFQYYCLVVLFTMIKTSIYDKDGIKPSNVCWMDQKFTLEVQYINKPPTKNSMAHCHSSNTKVTKPVKEMSAGLHTPELKNWKVWYKFQQSMKKVETDRIHSDYCQMQTATLSNGSDRPQNVSWGNNMWEWIHYYRFMIK